MSIVEDFLPVTRCGHVVGASAQRIATVLAESLSAGKSRGEVRKIDAKTLSGAFNTFTTVASNTTVGGYLVLSTAKPGWSSIIVDEEQAPLEWRLGVGLSRELRAAAIYYLLQPHTFRKEKGKEKGEYGAYQLVLADKGRLIRSVGVRYDAGWRFEAEGKIQKFERPSVYRATRTRERFGPSLLKEYLAAMGMLPFEDKFFLPGGRAHGYRVYAPWYDRSKKISLSTLRLRNGPFPGFMDESSANG